jgi:hypothetical protein
VDTRQNTRAESQQKNELIYGAVAVRTTVSRLASCNLTQCLGTWNLESTTSYRRAGAQIQTKHNVELGTWNRTTSYNVKISKEKIQTYAMSNDRRTRTGISPYLATNASRCQTVLAVQSAMAPGIRTGRLRSAYLAKAERCGVRYAQSEGGVVRVENSE